jgi:hypothetical protein
MECKECGVTFTPKRYDQRFCSSNCRKRSFDKEKALQASPDASSELAEMKRENEALHQRIEKLKQEKLDRDEYLKGIINNYKEIADQRDLEIDRLEDTIRERNSELERLMKEKQVLMNRPPAMLNRQHLQDVLNKELRSQFPKDPEIQAHIGAIRAFNASYINALVTA